jgi:hypothetical protein
MIGGAFTFTTPCVDNSNSSSLDHLWKKHQLDRTTGESLAGVGPSVKTSFADGVVYQQLTKQWTLSEFKDLLVRWMVYCHIAFRMVENEYFRELIKFLSSSLGGLLPRTASTIRGWILDAYLADKVTVERGLQRVVSNIHLSFDGWTSPNNYSILSVFAHFIDSGGVRRTRLLAFRRTYSAKSAENEAAALLKVIKEYNIEQRLGYFMCDNISTNDAPIDLILLELYPHWTTKQRKSRRLRCLSYVANICARALLLGAGASKALATLKAKIEKGAVDAEMTFWSKRGPVGMLHNMVRFIRASPQRIEMFVATVLSGLVAEFDVKKVSQSGSIQLMRRHPEALIGREAL